MFAEDEYGAKERSQITKFVRDMNKLKTAVEDLEVSIRFTC